LAWTARSTQGSIMESPLSKIQQQRRKQTEEGMWAVIRPFFNRRTAADNVAAANSSGLWKAPHVSQCCQWDCGVSCVQMVLRGLGREAERSSLLASLGTRSVWTIDLAMLLHRQGVRFMYGTRTAGVTEAYSTIDFYRANFDRDARRVQALFKAAEEAKVGAVQKAFSWQELAVLVSSYNYAAIVLVDSRYLYPTSYRAPSPAAPAQGDASGGTGSASPPPSWSTPKRSRDEAGERGDSFGWGLGSAESKGERCTVKTTVGCPSVRERTSAPPASPLPLGRRDENTRNLRTPPAPQSGRKSLASFPSGVFSASGAASEGEQEDGFSAECSRSAGEPVTIPTPVAGPSPSGTPRSSSPILLASPPPLKAAAAQPGSSRPTPLSPSSFLAAASPQPPAGSPHPLPSPSPDSSYCGHYILLVGWSEAERVFIARDPALPSAPPRPPAAAGATSGGGGEVGARNGDPSAHVCIALTPEALDRARRSYGTDEDVLVEWAWPDPAAWFAGQAADGNGGSGSGGVANKIEAEETTGGREGTRGGGKVVAGRQGVPRNGTAESAAKRLSSLLSHAASGLRFPTVGDAYRGPRVPWSNGTAEQERWAVRMASTMFMEGGRRAVYTLEGMLQGGRRAAYTMEGFLQGGALTMEGLLQGG
ncbi:unnamed protein product, partial [Scytosiphon promiscuus]